MTIAGLNVSTGAGPAGPGTITLFEGSSFCLCGPDGVINAVGRPHGVFYEDTRIISAWRVLLNGSPLEPLGVITPEPYRAVFIGRAVRSEGGADSTLLVERTRRVATGLREDIVVRSYGAAPTDCDLTVLVEADFADLFEVKDDRIWRHWAHTARVDGSRLLLESQWKEHQRGVVVDAPGAEVDLDRVRYRFTLAPRATWSASILVQPSVNGEPVPSAFPTGRTAEDSLPSRRHVAWRVGTPVARADDPRLEKVLETSTTDLGALRIYDPDHPDRAVVAAGAPWFMALFGRDSLLTSYMALPVDPSLALGTLQTLADLQGSAVDLATEEQPGRILHEVRLGVDSALALGGGRAYYGTVDATPLFVMLVGELCRWGGNDADVDALLPHVDRALDWITRFGDRDGDGFVEYARLTKNGLQNQGWKDSRDGVTFADGTLAAPPIALCEVQGYVYGAYMARALLAERHGEDRIADRWSSRAAELKESFNRRFWLPDRGHLALALDGDKRPVDSCASNMGHCLWTGIVDDDKAALVADRLLSPEMFTGWGIRTLAEDMGAYNPVSYHNGSVWPHDSALAVAGLMRYGFVEHAQRVANGLLDAADRFDARLPELFCGFARERYTDPIPYPTSCSPQAWATAAPFLLLRSLLRYDPCLPQRAVWLAPVLPEHLGGLHLMNAPLFGSRVTLDASGTTFLLEGLPPGIHLVRRPRAPGPRTAEAYPGTADGGGPLA